MGSDAFDDVSDRDREVSRIISAYWVQFAKTGNPNGDGLPVWPAFESGKDVLLDIGDEFAEREGFLKNRLDLHEKMSLERLAGAQ